MTLSIIPDPREQVLPVAENLFKAWLLIALLLASFYAADRVAAVLEMTTTLPRPLALFSEWGAVIVLGVFDVVVLTGMGVLAHEAVHRVLFRSAFWNEFWGGLLSALTLIPFHANRQFHLTHHRHAHQPGLDPENAMHHRPFVHAATLGGLIGLKEQYRILFANLRRARDPRFAARTLRDCAWLVFAGVIYFRLVPALGISLAVSVLPMILLFPLVFAFRAMSDHYGIPAVETNGRAREDVFDADAQTWQAGRERREREVTGWVVLTSPWLEWLWSHVNYHEVHHRYPYLSHRYLPRAFAATRARHAYRIVDGYWRSLFNSRQRPYYAAREAP